MINVLSLSVANYLSPALRYRILYPLNELKKQNVKYKHISLYSSHTHIILNKTGIIKKIIYSSIDFAIFILRILFYSRMSYSTVIVKTYLIPFGGALPEKIIYKLLKCNNVIYDIDDGIYLNQSRIQNKRLSFLRDAKSKCAFWLKHSNKVVYPNPIILNDLKEKFCLKEDKCHCYLSAPYVNQYFVNTNDIYLKKDESVISIIWLGAPSTQYDLVIAEKFLRELCNKNGNVVVYLIGTNDDFEYLNDLPQVKKIRWSQENEKKYMQISRFGLNPLRSSEFQTRKSAFKVIQYYRAGILPIVSDVGINSGLVNLYGGYCTANFEDYEDIISYIKKSSLEDNFSVFENTEKLSVEENAKVLNCIL